jgi:hypothetical protein
MFLVHLQLPLNDLAAHMCDMRIWLDRRNIETSGFSYKESSGCALVCVEFGAKRDAEAFSAWFADRGVPLTTAANNHPLVWKLEAGIDLPGAEFPNVRCRTSSSPALSNRRSSRVMETVG